MPFKVLSPSDHVSASALDPEDTNVGAVASIEPRTDGNTKRAFLSKIEAAEQNYQVTTTNIEGEARVQVASSPKGGNGDMSTTTSQGDEIIDGIGALRDVGDSRIAPPSIVGSSYPGVVEMESVPEGDAVSGDKNNPPVGQVGDTVDWNPLEDGLLSVRRLFNERIAELEGIANSGKSDDTGALLAFQLRLAQFGLLVEGTAKAVGQMNHASDALLKGQ